MTKLSPLERGVFLFTLVFLLATTGWFLLQNQERDLTHVVAERPPEKAVVAQEETKLPAPGILEGERININTAPLGDLTRLPGIGEVRAKSILDYRAQQGNFQSVEDLKLVSGIGEKTFEKLAPYVCVSD